MRLVQGTSPPPSRTEGWGWSDRPPPSPSSVFLKSTVPRPGAPRAHVLEGRPRGRLPDEGLLQIGILRHVLFRHTAQVPAGDRDTLDAVGTISHSLGVRVPLPGERFRRQRMTARRQRIGFAKQHFKVPYFSVSEKGSGRGGKIRERGRK